MVHTSYAAENSSFTLRVEDWEVRPALRDKNPRKATEPDDVPDVYMC